MKQIAQVVGNVSKILELCGKDIETIRTFRERCMHVDTDDQLLNVIVEYIDIGLPGHFTTQDKLNSLATAY